LEFQTPKPFQPKQPSWSPQPEPLWEPDSESDSFENQNLFAEDAEAEFFSPKPKKAKAAEEPQKQDGTETKTDGTKAAEKTQNPFGVEPDKLEQMVGSTDPGPERPSLPKTGGDRIAQRQESPETRQSLSGGSVHSRTSCLPGRRCGSRCPGS
jgi:hypothetical protein